jgi:CheY-like chemotaxis protein
LDINMPAISGFDVLRRTRERNAFKILPVFFIFTCSDNPHDREKALELGANGFCSKDISFNDSQKFVAWLDQKLHEIRGMP